MSKKYVNIAAAATTTVRSGPGFLEAILVNKTIASATITIYDNTAGSGTKIGTIAYPATLLNNTDQFNYGGVKFNTGLTIVTDQATDLTVVYRD